MAGEVAAAAQPPQPQTIAFATGGPVTGAVGTTVTNVASGGAGTGAITYASSAAHRCHREFHNRCGNARRHWQCHHHSDQSRELGFNSATATYQLQVTPGTQAIAFAVAGPRNVVLNATSDNAASGGAGTGAITYASNNTNAVTVNATTGTATAAGLGSATITATKAADVNYNAAQATYIVNVQSAGSVHAWVGEQASEVFLPATANGKQFARARVTDCALVRERSGELARTSTRVPSTAQRSWTPRPHSRRLRTTRSSTVRMSARRWSRIRSASASASSTAPCSSTTAIGSLAARRRFYPAPRRRTRCTRRSRTSGPRAMARPGGSRLPTQPSARAGCTDARVQQRDLDSRRQPT